MPKVEPAGRLEWLRPVAFPGTELLIARGDQTMWRVFHENYAVVGCTTAQFTYRYRGRLHALQGAGFALLEPGEMHANRTVEKPATFDVVFIDAYAFGEAARELGLSGTPHFAAACGSHRRLLDAAYGFCRSVESNEDLFAQQVWQALCIRTMLEFTERRPAGLSAASAGGLIERAKQYLLERFDESVTLDEVAAHARISKYRLARMFTQQVGSPPHAFQNRVRVERGRMLLKAGMSPASVAATLGFADQSHFTRHFRRVWQITPAAYASAVR